jgi:hypothetical protein
VVLPEETAALVNLTLLQGLAPIHRMPVAAVEALEQVPVQEALVEEVVVHQDLALEQQEIPIPEEVVVADMLLPLLMLAATAVQALLSSKFPIPKPQLSLLV